MPTLETTDDLLRAAWENQEFRQAFRREILTEELMAAPGDIRELKEITKNIAASGESLNEHAATTNQQLGIMAEGINNLVSGIADMNRNLTEKIDEIRISHQEEHDALHRFRGNYAIEATRNNRSNIAEKFAEVRGIDRYRLTTLSAEECNDLFDENLDAIDLLDTEGNISKTFPEGDVIARANYRRSGDTIFYIVVEASYTVNANDVIRASDHAKILRAITGHETFAVVSGVEVGSEIGNSYRQRIIEDLAEYLESERDDVVFLFRLTDRSLEPLPIKIR